MLDMRITSTETELLVKFRANLSDLNLNSEKNSDAYLIRWLRAREGHLKKSEDMLRASLKWREKSNIDSIRDWQVPPKYMAMFPSELCGYDKNGNPVLVIAAKYLDANVISQFGKSEFSRFILQRLETAMSAGKNYNSEENRMFQQVIISDLSEMNVLPFFTRAFMFMFRDLSKIYMDNYPEFVHVAYAINAPKLFSTFFKVLKVFIPKRTLERIKFYGPNEDEVWKKDLLSHIPVDQLPVRYGGTNEEFEKTAFLNLKPVGFREDGSILLKVPAGKKIILPCQVQDPGTKLKWSFKTEAHDIGFSILFDGEEIVEPQRVNAQEGSLYCEQQGEYTLVFENTYSRLRSKTVYYRVDLLANGECSRRNSITSNASREIECSA